jgi:hypothetical protein
LLYRDGTRKNRVYARNLAAQDDGVIADYTLIYGASAFEGDSVEDVVADINKVVDSSLDSLKNKSVGDYPTDPDYIDDTVKGELGNQSE